MMLAFRIVFPEYDMTLSTREKKEFRDRAALMCVNNLSAGSLVSPGSYSEPAKGPGQFSLNDTRTVDEMIRDMQLLGLEPITKYWDAAIT
jgi:2-iminoacetate synthase